MKKSLLSLALAGIAATAFANVDVYKSQSANLFVKGQLEAGYVKEKVTDRGYEKSVKVSQQKSTQLDKLVDARLGIGAKFNNADSLTYGFYTEYKAKPVTEKVYTRKAQVTDGVVGAYEATDYTRTSLFKADKAVLNKAYVTLGHKNFGSAVYGYGVGTVVDDAYGNSLEFLSVKSGFTGLSTSFDRVAKWSLPTIIEGLKFAYSFGNEYDVTGKNSYNYSRQNAYSVAYGNDYFDAKFTAAFEKDYANPSAELTHKVNGFQLTVSNDKLVKDLSLSAAYSYSKEVQYVGYLENVAAKSKTNTVAAEVKYTGFQYAKPFLGASFTRENTTEDAQTTKVKQYGVYAGLTSDLYKSQYANVTAYAEGAFVKTTTKKSETPDAKEKAKSKQYAFGVKVTF